MISAITLNFNNIQTLIISFSNTFAILINGCHPFSYASSTNFEVLSCKIVIQGANNLVVIKMKFKTATFTSTSLSIRTEYQAIKNPSSAGASTFSLYGYVINTGKYIYFFFHRKYFDMYVHFLNFYNIENLQNLYLK